jgi:signal transduction histidine kinase
MTFRLRLVLALLAVAVLPLALLAVGARREIAGRLREQYRGRIAAIAADFARQVDGESRTIATRLAAIGVDLANDTRFRLAAVQGIPEHRPYLLDFAGTVMRTAGLDYLQIQDSAGRILSSGHYPAEYDREDPGIPAGLARLSGAPAIVEGRTASGTFLALVRADSLVIGAARFTLVGGVAAPPVLSRVAAEPDFVLAVLLPDTVLASHASVGAAMDSARREGVEPLAILSAGRLVERGPDLATVSSAGEIATGQIVVASPADRLAAVVAGVNRWTLIAGLAAAAVAVTLALVLSAALSRPIQSLARAAEAVDLERADTAFATGRSDELGVLARLLGSMMGRLRADAARLRDAERRVAVGDLARQVNHDVKNGLAPLRNVFRHLDEVARDQPDRLAAIFAERRGTVESGLTYLERLAGTYAKLAPSVGWHRCDVAALVREVAGAGGGGVDIQVQTADGLPALRTDPVVLRRIVENLVRNAVESLDGKGGTVRIGAAALPTGVRISVSDSGRGMTRDELDRAFEPFSTTKPGGSGLGLAIVRRLVADLGGTLRLSSQPGTGTEAVVELPSGTGA